MHDYEGACRCGAVRVTLKSELAPEQFQPRSDAATCGFCAEHGGIWILDAKGGLIVDSNAPTEQKVFATGQVHFVFCSRCHDLTYATFADTGDGPKVAVVRRDLFSAIASQAQPVATTNFETESPRASGERRLRNWTPIQPDIRPPAK